MPVLTIDEQIAENEARIKELREKKEKPVTKARVAKESELDVPKNGAQTTTGGLWGSRPFRLVKAIGLGCGKIDKSRAKIEHETCEKVRKAMVETGAGATDFSADSTIVPFNTDFLPDVLWEHDDFQEAMLVIKGGMGNADREEVAQIRKNLMLHKAETPMSAFTAQFGGTLVAPPVMGQLEPLMRPVPALTRIGARTVPLPPNGKYTAPRIVSPTTGYWVKENAAFTESQLGTGNWNLQAKKLGVLARIPNELYRYAAPATDAALRGDMTQTLELGLDYAALYGAGGGDEPTGLIRYNGTNEVITYTASTTGANGDTLQPQDGYKMSGQVAGRNFTFEGFVIRTELWAKVASTRGDAVAIGDQQGPFVGGQMREPGQGYNTDSQNNVVQWDGFRAVLSNVTPNNLTKGTGTTLTEVWGGMWSKLTIAMYGAIEFAQSNQAGTAFAQDQTLVRGLLLCDVGTPFPGAFIRCTSLLTT